MAAIDAHQHFWKYAPLKDGWITEQMQVLKRDFLPVDLKPVLERNNVDGCILVQSDQTKEHNNFLLQLANENDFIKGVVGWVDLQTDNVRDQLASYQHLKKMKGFRHILQSEQDRSLMLKPPFKRGIAALEMFNYTYDILIYPDQLEYAVELVTSFPYQPFILDHIAKPNIKEHKIVEWEKGIRALAERPNVYCKISGLVNEADWSNWKKEDFSPYLDVVVESFGMERLLFGSDWPVCLLAASYKQVIAIVKDYFSSFSTNEQQLFFEENAKRFYNLN